MDTILEPSTIDGFDLCEKKHIRENATKNYVCVDMVSRKGDHLINEDMKVSQAGDLKDLKKENIEVEDAPHCVLRMIPYSILAKKEPIAVYVKVVEGIAKIGTRLCIPCRDFIYIGRIVAMKGCNDYELLDYAGEGETMQIQVMCKYGEQPKLLGRNAMAKELLVSCKGRE